VILKKEGAGGGFSYRGDMHEGDMKCRWAACEANNPSEKCSHSRRFPLAFLRSCRWTDSQQKSHSRSCFLLWVGCKYECSESNSKSDTHMLLKISVRAQMEKLKWDK